MTDSHVPVICLGCQHTETVPLSAVTASLRCSCGSTDLDVFEPHMAAGPKEYGSTSVPTHQPAPTIEGWNEYQGPMPGQNTQSNGIPTPITCPVCHGSGFDPQDSEGGGFGGTCRTCYGTGFYTPMTSATPPMVARHPYPSTQTKVPFMGSPGTTASMYKTTDAKGFSDPMQVEYQLRRTDPQYDPQGRKGPEDKSRPFNPNRSDTFYPKSQERSPAIHYRKPHPYDQETAKPFEMPGTHCPNCGHEPLGLKRDQNDDAWASCFAGETQYLTRDGLKTFAETVGTTQWVLTGSDDPRGGWWVQAPISSFGTQQIWEIDLKRGQQKKTIRTTASHRWRVGRWKRGHYEWRIITTENLSRGHRLAHLRPSMISVEPDHDGIRRGAFFGDGNTVRQKAGPQDQRPYGRMILFGEKIKALSDIFAEFCPLPPIEDGPSEKYSVPSVRFHSGMKGWTKELPALDETPEFLYGWLMGLMATDGCVDKTGAVSISSAHLDTLEHVRNIATLLGIGTYRIRSQNRLGYGNVEKPIFELSFVASDFRPEFFLKESHRNNFEFESPDRARLGWTVESVCKTDAQEEVYCATVSDTESFVLADNIWTMNCPNCGPLVNIDRHPEYDPYKFTWETEFPKNNFKPKQSRKAATKKTGRLLSIIATVHRSNPGLSIREVVTLARNTVARY